MVSVLWGLTKPTLTNVDTSKNSIKYISNSCPTSLLKRSKARKNRRNVDLNRDFPIYGREDLESSTHVVQPETKAMEGRN